MEKDINGVEKYELTAKLKFVTEQTLLWRKLKFVKNTDSGERKPRSVSRIAEQLVEEL